MIKLGVFIIVLAAVGVVCAVFNIAYNPEEYEYTDYRADRRRDYRQDYRQDYRTDEPEGGERRD